ncbi:hypothetical protein [Pseudomonas protegens]|uniref:hypothetical protein n=1 Tax=Pseudomonas protegens TaxID=380021 RepID=UPI00384B88D2
MLRKLLESLFGPKPSSQSSMNTPRDTEVASQLVEYFKIEIAASPYIKESGRLAVLNDFLHRAKLSDEEALTTEQKRSMGLNVRMKITKGHLAALTDEGLLIGPKPVLHPLYLRATHKHSRRECIARISAAGLKSYSVLSCGDERDCDWCKSMDGKSIITSQDFDDLAEQNCSCEYCRCTLIAKMKR